MRLLLTLWWTVATAEEARQAQRAEVARINAAAGALAEPCWAAARTGDRRLCASLDEALAADAGELATVGVVVAWCADDFHWVGDFLRMVASKWPQGENVTQWKRLVVYQKCVIHKRDGKLVAGAGNLHGGKGRALDFDVTGPNLTLAPIDVRNACRATVGANQKVVEAAVEALEIRIIHMIEPGRSHRASTDEAGAVLHYLSTCYNDLNDATFFAHGHVRGELGPFMETLRHARDKHAVQATFVATTRYKAIRDTANAWVRDVLNVSDADYRQPRGGAYRNGEFILPRLVARKRSRAFYAAALGAIVHDAKCQAAASLRNGGDADRLPPPFDRYLDGLAGCDWRVYTGNHGGHLIEGWWPQLFCEPCVTPARRDDPRIPYESQRRLLLRRREVERVGELSRRRLDTKRQKEVERMDKTILGTALEAACWGVDVRGRKSCLSYDDALTADAAFPPSEVGSVAFVVAWCGDRFDWVSDLMARSRGAPQAWKRLTVYQKCAIYNSSDGGHEVRFTHDLAATTKAQKLDCTVTGPNTTLTSTDVRRSIMKHSRAAVNSSVAKALRALDVRVVALIEPGRGYPTGPRKRANMFYSTDEAGAYLHHISRAYNDLADGTFFVHGHLHGGYDAAVKTLDWTAASGVAPQTYFGTTRMSATRIGPGGGMPSALGVPVKDAMRKPRGGNYRNGS